MNDTLNVSDFKQNAHGYWVPLSMIEPLDLQRDEVVNELFDRAEALQRQLAEFKTDCYNSINAHRQLSAEQHKVDIDLSKDGVLLSSFDGMRSIKVRFDSQLKVDEKIYEAKALLDQCMAEWAQDSSSKELKLFIQQLFNTKSGGVDIKGLLALRRYKIENDKWTLAMELIHKSIDGSKKKAYINFYQRQGAEEKQEQLSLNFTSL